MWSTEIEQNLKHDAYFMGCYSPDLLPSFPNSFPRTLIIYTMPSNKEGNIGLLSFEKEEVLLFRFIWTSYYEREYSKIP